ncbi:Tetratricopeptide repeat-containing protein [Desulfovibrio sp. X2]|uniref:tetratricopeptide repeat protein n=1 Tax=Desulfovibrio sp. X2 TaxID=941449 RepID=UPI00035898AB|nr:tetratricopeptide repeat protein [Desulfovibrio sp. X2]EPR42421.1 Tetratricopeptide repeat-containing protein [Desulfovibrio sp. X2]
MSAELIKARQLINKISSNLKQKKLQSAAQSLQDALLIILKTPLMKNEREEFTQLIEQAVYHLRGDREFAKAYPLQLEYTPGEEKQLYTQMVEAVKELSASSTEEAQALLALMAKRKEDGLKKVEAQLASGKHAEAKQSADNLIREFASDTDLKAEVADLFLKHELYQEAYGYLEEALKNDPGAAHLYNRIAIVLRKMKDYATAEQYYRKALQCCQHDEYLFFNIGRLYHDWQKWKHMAEMAKRALKINPGFEQAQKMLQFAMKKLEQDG